MVKFKAGDVVTCLDSRGMLRITKGLDYTVLDYYGDCIEVQTDDGSLGSYSNYRFELKEEEKKMKFKVGDIVRQSDRGFYMFGTGVEGTKDVHGVIKDVNTEKETSDDFDYTVDFGHVGYDASHWVMFEHELELVQSFDPVSPAPTGKIKSDGGSSAYYQFPDGAKELNDLIEHKEMSFARGNLLKALYRLGEKEGVDVLYDLNKMQLFLDRLKKMHSEGKRL